MAWFPASPIISLSDCKAFMKVPSTFTSDDTLITNLIAGVSQQVEDRLGTFMIQQGTSGSPIVERYWGGVKTIFLRHGPLTQASDVISIVDDSGYTVLVQDYYVDYEHGFIRNYGRFPIAQTPYGAPGQWIISTKNVGWFADLAAVPYNVAHAVAQLVSLLYDRPTPADSVNAGGLSVSYTKPEALWMWPPSVSMALDRFAWGRCP